MESVNAKEELRLMKQHVLLLTERNRLLKEQNKLLKMLVEAELERTHPGNGFKFPADGGDEGE